MNIIVARCALLLGFAAAALLCPQASLAANPDKLWEIVNGECVPNMRAHGNPAPCRAADLPRGFIMLKDIVGAGQFLLIPTQRLTGIESPELLAPDAPNYWAYAWEQRRLVGQALGRRLARDRIGLEINSAAARSQLQLHIHIDCIRADLPQLLRAHQSDAPGRWQPLMLDGHEYRIMRLAGATLGENNPFKLAAAISPFAASAMGAQSLLLTGAYFDNGDKGFYLIDSPVNFERGERGNAEVWLDHDCR
ncbi:CDP-diacylglycerol diphosphatase [Oxalobacteraceae bacterium CAVE-383]|nr:CDP-diacylglycerol diphosphatase [Oxalobacteraceae bacterium CAVE-383]